MSADISHDNDFAYFDTQTYYETRYSRLDVPAWSKGQLPFLIDTLSEVYNSGKISGSTLLDIGTGPTIYNMISAAHHFSNIFLSDICENNRNALWRWVTNDPAANDFSHFFKYLAEKEKLVGTWYDNEADMRSRIRGILACDMTRDNPLYPSMFSPFDVISSSLCLSSIPTVTMAAYETVVRNVASLLKPGGWFVYMDEINNHSYTVGSSKYDILSPNQEDVIRVWSSVGFTIDMWKSFDNTEKEKSDSTLRADSSRSEPAVFCMTARKD